MSTNFLFVRRFPWPSEVKGRSANHCKLLRKNSSFSGGRPAAARLLFLSRITHPRARSVFSRRKKRWKKSLRRKPRYAARFIGLPPRRRRDVERHDGARPAERTVAGTVQALLHPSCFGEEKLVTSLSERFLSWPACFPRPAPPPAGRQWGAHGNSWPSYLFHLGRLVARFVRASVSSLVRYRMMLFVCFIFLLETGRAAGSHLKRVKWVTGSVREKMLELFLIIRLLKCYVVRDVFRKV